MADADSAQRRSHAEGRRDDDDGQNARREEETSGRELGSAADSFWSNAIWLTGADGKSRRAQPGIPLLAHGIPNRVGKLRAYGNAIVPPLAAQVIGAYLDAEKEIKARLNQPE
jgi:DNA (cytosine-5)-methyltransferase 1